MVKSQNLSQKKPKLRNSATSNIASKPIEMDNDDIVAWMGLVTLSSYFGVSFEQAMNRALNPAMKKLVSDLRTYLQDQ